MNKEDIRKVYNHMPILQRIFRNAFTFYNFSPLPYIFYLDSISTFLAEILFQSNKEKNYGHINKTEINILNKR